uniref:hypothetical protein n=1 Tax=Fuscoporia viticola TaxID=139386 RepID=UPI0023AAE94C|nr:hypothetical protein P1Q19_mgp20 [Fuscoporia viticola]WCF76839.1 hypothetical protein [Fuscoporia viticola]
MPTKVIENYNAQSSDGFAPKVEGLINNIGPDLYNELKESYFGGHTDMYIPCGPIANDKGFSKPEDKAIVPHDNKYIYEYDVNSLYPSVMANNKYPNKLFGKFIGDIRYFDRFNYLFDDMLSICRVRVTAPLGLANPILPFRDTKSGRIIYPEGTWIGMYTSVEIKNAIKYGYKFDILSGYLFTAEDLFNGYVKSFYQMKENSTKGTAMYTLSKLLLNSLYGRFGLNPTLDNFIITTKKDMVNKLKTDLPYLQERIDFGDISMCSFHSKSPASSNVAIASFVTAYARIHMSSFKNQKGFSVYYTDTDSIFTNTPLSPELVDSKKLGYMKLEDVFSYFISIGAKNWIGINTDGQITCKMKGSKNKLNYLDFLSLLRVNTDLKINHSKWFKSFKKSNIIIKDSPFTIKYNNNKRELIFNNGLLVNTKNINVNLMAKYNSDQNITWFIIFNNLVLNPFWYMNASRLTSLASFHIPLLRD